MKRRSKTLIVDDTTEPTDTTEPSKPVQAPRVPRWKATTLEALLVEVRACTSGRSLTRGAHDSYFEAVGFGWHGHMGQWTAYVREEAPAPVRRTTARAAAPVSVEAEAEVEPDQDALIRDWLGE